jgi:hypothetical protein
MTTLVELIETISSYTDKNDVHSYLDTYEQLFVSKKNTAKNVLEIGIGNFREKNGGSIELWNAYFTNAKIYGLDIIPKNLLFVDYNDEQKNKLYNNDNVILYTGIDAYNEEFFTNNFLNKNIKFDVVLDDGPHSLDSMIQFIKLYSQVMTDDGILIIEDVQDVNWLNILANAVPDHLKPFIELYDLRANKNRYDDLLFVINKNKI